MEDEGVGDYAAELAAATTTAAALLLPGAGSSAVVSCRPRAYGFTTRWWTMWWSIPTGPAYAELRGQLRPGLRAAPPPTDSIPTPLDNRKLIARRGPWSCGPTVHQSGHRHSLRVEKANEEGIAQRITLSESVPRAACRWRLVRFSGQRRGHLFVADTLELCDGGMLDPSFWARRRLTATARKCLKFGSAAPAPEALSTSPKIPNACFLPEPLPQAA
ncbi:MAG: hypothetical protein ACLT5P_08235 [Flavonifractor plautii]